MTTYENDSESMQDVSRIGVKRAVEAAINVTRKTVKDAAQAQRNILHRGGDVFTAQCRLREALLAQSMANQAKSALEFDDAYALAAAEEALREAFEVRASMPCLPPPPAAEAPVEQSVTEAPVEAAPANVPVEMPVDMPIRVGARMSQRSYIQIPVEQPVDVPVSQHSSVQVPVEMPVEQPAEVPVQQPVEVPVEMPVEVLVAFRQTPPVEAVANVAVEEFAPRGVAPEAGRHAAATTAQRVAGAQHAAPTEQDAVAPVAQKTTHPNAEGGATRRRGTHTRAARMRGSRMQSTPARDFAAHAAPAVFEPEEATFSPEENKASASVAQTSAYSAPNPQVVETSNTPSPYVVATGAYSTTPQVARPCNLSEAELPPVSVAQTIDPVESLPYIFPGQNSSFFSEPARPASEVRNENSGNSDALFKKHRRDKSFTIPFGPLSEEVSENAGESLFYGACGVQPFEAENPQATVVQPQHAAAQPEHVAVQPQRTAQPEVAVAQPERTAQPEVAAQMPCRITAQHAAPSTSTSTSQNTPDSPRTRKVDRAPAYDVENLPTAQVSQQTSSKPAPAHTAAAPARTAPAKRTVPASAAARKKAEKKAAKMVISKKITAEEAPDMVKKLLAEETAVPVESARTPEKPHVVRRVCIALGLVVVLAAGLGLAAYFGLISLPWGLQQRVEMLPEINAKTGSLNVKPATVAPGDYRLVLNQTPRVAAGSLECPIQFENPEGNEYNSRLVLVLADGGEQIASTHRLSPNSYVDSINLSRALEPGTYEATAVVSVLAGTTQINSMSASVTITVK